jgi:heterodisulfide reductase subunit A
VTYLDKKGEANHLDVDMVILSTAMVPDRGAPGLAAALGIECDSRGFFRAAGDDMSSVESSRAGIFIAGTAEGPKDGQTSVVQAEAAVGKVLVFLERCRPQDAEAEATAEAGTTDRGGRNP